MAENRTWNNGILVLQTTYKFIHILMGIKAKSMHSSVQFDMNGETSNAFFLCFFNQSIK